MKKIISLIIFLMAFVCSVTAFSIEAEAMELGEVKTKFYIEFDSGTGSGETIILGPWDLGETTFLPSAGSLGYEKEGCYCSGWKIGGKTYSEGAPYTNNGSGSSYVDQYLVTATAVWIYEEKSDVEIFPNEGESSDVETVCVTYNAGNASGTAVLKYYDKGEEFSLIYCPFTYKYHTFNGWECSINGNVYEEGQRIASHADVIFTATWKKNIIASGDCGENLKWYLTEDGTLTISGEGEMADYEAEKAPWYEYKDAVTSLVLGKDITSIGDFAFYGMDSITGRLVIPNNVKTIGTHSFNGCKSFTALTLGNSVETIEEGAFLNCEGFLGSLIIPDSVKTIGKNVFYACRGFIALNLGSGVETIGEAAFCHCNGFTGNLVIPEGVAKIGRSAFSSCYGINGKLIIPESVAEIGTSPFSNCFGLKEVEVAEENPNYCAIDGALYTKDGKTLICYPGSRTGACSVNKGTEVIGESVFYHSEASLVILPESVKTIKKGAFAFFDGGIVATGKIDTIESGAIGFRDDNISLYFMSGAPLNISTGEDPSFTSGNDCVINLYYLEGTEELWNFDENGLWNGYSVNPADKFGYCGGEEDGKNLFWFLDDEGTLIIMGEGPMSDENHPWRQPEHIGNITSIVLDNDITTIGNQAFNGISSAVCELILPEKLVSIGEHAFNNCSGLFGNLIIPEGVTKIGTDAFGGCSGFNGKLVLPENLEIIKPNTFTNCSGFSGELVIPDSVIRIESWAFSHCAGFSSLSLGNKIETIGEWAFENCYFSGKIELPETLKTLGYGAFYGNYFTGDLIIPDNVTSIGDSAFQNNGYFDGNLIIGKNVKTIGVDAFCGCGFSGKLVLPEGLTMIKNYAFNRCYGFSGKLTLPESIRSVGSGSFLNCGFSEYVFPGNAPFVAAAAENVGSFDADDVIYYYANTEDWVIDEEEKWKGYTAKALYPLSGFCGAEGDGSNLSWKFDGSTGTLAISGIGTMADFDFVEENDEIVGSTAPWFPHKDNIKTIVLEEGITYIGKCAFAKLDLSGESLSLPEGIERIGTCAFWNCGFTGELVLPSTIKRAEDSAFEHAGTFTGKLVIPAGMEYIGHYAFRDGAYSEIEIPATVTFIGKGAFVFNEELEKITVAKDNENYCSENGVLFNKDKTELIQYTNGITDEYTVPETVETIIRNAFGFTKAEKVIVPENVKIIERNTFFGSKTTIVFEGAPEEIGRYAVTDFGKVFFMNGAPKSVVAAGEEEPSFGEKTELHYLIGTEDGWTFDENGLWNGYELSAFVIGENGETLPTGYCGASEDGKNLVWTIYPDGTLEISGTGKMADFTWDAENAKSSAPWFKHRNSITSLVLEEGITEIGNYAFRYCEQLSGELVIPEGVSEIGMHAFGNTSFTGTLVLPKSLGHIGAHAFKSNDFEGTLIIPENVKIIGPYAFSFCEFTDAQIPASVIAVGAGAFNWAEEVTISEENENYCSNDGIVFTKDKKEIVGFPSTRTGSYKIPETVETIGASAFSCSKLDEIIIGENVRNVGRVAFEYVNGDIIINSALESIGEKAFWPLEGKTNVYFKAGEPSGVDENAFNNADGTINLYYLEGTEEKWTFDSEGKWNGFEIYPSAATNTVVEISSETVVIGKNKTVYVNISENSAAAMLQFSIKYDPSVLEVVYCNAGYITENATIDYSKPGKINFVWEDTNALTSGGTVLEIRFTTAENASEQETAVEMNYERDFIIKNTSKTDIKTETVNGKITVVEAVFGDVNGDGKINVVDAYIVRLYSAKLEEYNEAEKAAADVDGDGKITAIDANYIRRYAAEMINVFPVEEQ